MPTHIRELRCEKTCVGFRSRGRFPGLGSKSPRQRCEGYVIVQRHFEVPTTEGSATSKLTTGSSAAISGSKARICPGISSRLPSTGEPVKKQIAVLFSAADPVYAEVRRVLQIMIPGINTS